MISLNSPKLLQTSVSRLIVPLFVFFAAWWLVTRDGGIPEYLVPPPGSVLTRLNTLAIEGILQKHLFATLKIVIGGFMIGSVVGVVCGAFVARHRLVGKHLLPIIVALQSVPLVAFAPLFLLWFESSSSAKIAIAALIVLFPVFTGTVEGFKKENMLFTRLFQSLGAKRRDRWLLLRVPLAIPHIYAGIKTSVPLALVGAVVGELLGTDEGLGYLLQSGAGLYDTPLVFGVILVLAMLGLTFFALSLVVEKFFLERYFYS